MKYVDSNVFIHALIGMRSDKKTVAAQTILMKVADGSLVAATSLLTWDEVTWALKKKLGREVADMEGRKLLEYPNLKFLDIKTNIIISAQSLASTYGLDPRDAIHAASCIENGIDEIITDDSDFDVVTGLKRIPLEKAV